MQDSGAFAPSPEQRAVIDAAAHDWLLVVAGPGTGKTQVAAMRLARLLRTGLQPAQILVLSFSRSAVATLTQRLSKVQLEETGVLEDLRHIAIRTFDAWAFRMLRQGGAPAAELLSGTHDDNIAHVTVALNNPEDGIGERLRSVRHVIVDEFQDLPGVRADMVRALLRRLEAEGAGPIGCTVLGDPAQAIYRFAARNSGDPLPTDPWQQLRADMGGRLREIELTRNHRSVPKLAEMAFKLRKILSSNSHDAEKKLHAMQHLLARLPPTGGEGKLAPEWLAELRDGSLAILTRTNGEAMGVWKLLCGTSVEPPSLPVKLRLAGENLAAPVWVAALLSAYRFNSITREVFLTAYDRLQTRLGPDACTELGLPLEGVAWKRLARATGVAETSTSIDLEVLRQRLDWPDSFPEDRVREDAAVYVTTVHQAKGMEFQNVALLEQRLRDKDESPEDPLEEANVGFVAITRAGRQLRRLPPSAIYAPARQHRFRSGRVRQVSWGKMLNVQIGLQGDIDPCSFVDVELHGGEEAVKILQDQLLRQAMEWRGRKVLLEKVSLTDADGQRTVCYNVSIQTEQGRGPLIGRTSDQVTRDLLDLLWKAGYQLPKNIYNLRVGDVISCSVQGDLPESVPEPFRSAHLWLGISLMGTGDFTKWKRNEG